MFAGTGRRGGLGVSIGAAVLLALAGGCASGAETALAPMAPAADVLKASGVKGGLIVHLGCGEGKLTAALGAGEGYLVHGLDADAVKVEAARKHIRSLGLYGKVSVQQWRGGRLPYIDNLVNLLIAEDLGDVPMAEVMRVLTPGGVAYVRKGGEWSRRVKPRPGEIDEWTHYLHDPSNNPVAHDSVIAPSRRLQWVGGPLWARHHDHMASMSACVSAGGRIFYIFDEGSTASIQLPSKWSLIARDAFNGVVLWKRPIETWHTRLWPLKSGPAQLPRRLVAVGDRVYVTLGLYAPLVALDAATGETVRTYPETKGAEEVILSDGVLLALVNKSAKKPPKYRPIKTYCWDETSRANRKWAWAGEPRRIMAVRADTGEVLWQKDSPVAPLTLAADAKNVLFYDGKKVVCLDRTNGKPRWNSEPVGAKRIIRTSFGPTLVLYKDVVLFAGGDRKMTGLSAKTGGQLWQEKHPRSGHQSPEDMIVTGGLVWAGAIAQGKDSGVFVGRDPHTGEIKSQFPPDVETYWFHQRCYRSKATDRYLLPSRTGIEFIDFRAKSWDVNHWVRGGCIYGIMPANGLIYTPPHACACYMESKLNGFCALAGELSAEAKVANVADDERLVRGPAYGAALAEGGKESPGDWPTYRHDGGRSGWTKTAVPADLKPAWETKLGGRLSSVVVAAGRAFVAAIDTHTVHALDAGLGEKLWSYTAGARVDSPPTIWRGRAIFGSADGFVYCLRASDGALIWRFLAAPREARLVAVGQLESPWPVHGSVLVREDPAAGGKAVVYCVAGRSMFLDGGMRLLRLDAATGRKLSETVLDDGNPITDKPLQKSLKGLTMPAALPDVLSTDGRSVYMRSQRFDLTGRRTEIGVKKISEQGGEGVHLFSPVGFLDGTSLHRSYWIYGTNFAGGWGNWLRAGRYAPSGRILAIDDSRIYGYGRKPQFMCQSSVIEHHLFAAAKAIPPKAVRNVNRTASKMNKEANRNLPKGRKKKSVAVADWRVRGRYAAKDLTVAALKWTKNDPPLQARALAMAGDTLFFAGPPDLADEVAAFDRPDDPAILAALAEQDEALQGKRGALLWAVSAKDGAKLAEYKLAFPPVWDGLAAANGRLYFATTDGAVICYEGK